MSIRATLVTSIADFGLYPNGMNPSLYTVQSILNVTLFSSLQHINVSTSPFFHNCNTPLVDSLIFFKPVTFDWMLLLLAEEYCFYDDLLILPVIAQDIAWLKFLELVFLNCNTPSWVNLQ